MKNIIGIEDNIRVLAKGSMGAISVLFDTTSKLQERFDLLTATNLKYEQNTALCTLVIESLCLPVRAR